jgi:hypothetical protein
LRPFARKVPVAHSVEPGGQVVSFKSPRMRDDDRLVVSYDRDGNVLEAHIRRPTRLTLYLKGRR